MNNNKKSGGGIIFGFILFIAGVGLLWWNEGRTVKTASAIKEANDLVVDISSSEINSEFEGKVVNTNGEAIYNDVNDPDFDIELNALVLNRVVEMYQWSEDCDDDNVCTYTKKWDSNLISSASFQSGHTNPDNMPYDSKTYYAENVNLGAFIIPTDFLMDLNTPKEFNAATPNNGYRYVNGYFISYDGEPNIGDIRVSFKYNDAKTLTVLGVQTGNTFKPFAAKSGVNISLLHDGILTSKDMIKVLNDNNKATKWMFRAIGTFIVIMAVTMIISPLTKLLGYIPLLGNVVGGVLVFIAALLGLAVSLLVIAIAWFRYRPILSIILIIGIIVAIVLAKMLSKKKNNAPQTA